MIKKGDNFFEKNVQNIVLAIVGLVCIWLLIARVIVSPVYVKYDNKKFGVNEIDVYINNQAKVVENKLGREPEQPKVYVSCLDKFEALLESAVGNIDTSLYPPRPKYSSTEEVIKPRYDIPAIGTVDDVKVGHLRAVAYIPSGEINEENVYEKALNEPNDLDFVTVEARFDVAKLNKSFYENFAAESIREEWRNQELAKPIFAAVELQRQELLSDGSCSDWQDVPRTRIDHNRNLFQAIDDIKSLPAGGMKVRLLQFNDFKITSALLQPRTYEIASADEEWFPPSLHRQYLDYKKELEAKESRETKAAEKEDRDKERPDRRARPTKTKSGAGSIGGGGMSTQGMYGISAKKTTTKRKVTERQSDKPALDTTEKTSTSNIYEKFDKISLSKGADLAKMTEPLVFWAHDDTVEPNKSYRYRVRLGVFNPIAGTNKFSEKVQSEKDKVILWSDFSDTTDVVNIPGILYFFPREIQESTKTVTVGVSRYILGYWYSKDFAVKAGEAIGKVSGYEPLEEEKEVKVPKKIDYATGVVLVDAVPVNDWSGGKNLRARYYFDMLYSLDGIDIDNMPIGSKYWSEDLQAKFNEIQKLEKEPKKPLREWGVKAAEPESEQKGGGNIMEQYMNLMKK